MTPSLYSNCPKKPPRRLTSLLTSHCNALHESKVLTLSSPAIRRTHSSPSRASLRCSKLQQLRPQAMPHLQRHPSIALLDSPIPSDLPLLASPDPSASTHLWVPPSRRQSSNHPPASGLLLLSTIIVKFWQHMGNAQSLPRQSPRHHSSAWMEHSSSINLTSCRLSLAILENLPVALQRRPSLI